LIEADVELAIKVAGLIVTLTAFAYGVKHMADKALHLAEAAEQKTTACFRKLDQLVKAMHDEEMHRAKMEGELGAWKERLKVVGDGVHSTRTELGNRITRLEDRLDVLAEKD
jgi:hypothetical protein